MDSGGTRDEALARVVDFFLRQNGFEEQAAIVLRQALNEVIDGMRTGRWSLDSLQKTEKTYIGTKVEILFKFEFELPDGESLDARIEGEEIDIKCTVRNSWMIPEEAFGKLCLLVRIDDRKSRFSIGVVRVDPMRLSHGRNRDRKATISVSSGQDIHWVVENGKLPINLIGSLSAEARDAIFAKPLGTRRIAELFRQVHGVKIPRAVLETLAKQQDPTRRAREAREILAGEGIEVLQGHWKDDRARARALGCLDLGSSEWIAFGTGSQAESIQDR